MCPSSKQFGFRTTSEIGTFLLGFRTIWKQNDPTWDTKLDRFILKKWLPNDPAFLSVQKPNENVRFLDVIFCISNLNADNEYRLYHNNKVVIWAVAIFHKFWNTEKCQNQDVGNRESVKIQTRHRPVFRQLLTSINQKQGWDRLAQKNVNNLATLNLMERT